MSKDPGYSDSKKDSMEWKIRTLEAEIQTLKTALQIKTDSLRIVKAKEFDEMRSLVRSEEIDLVHVSDDGEMFAYGTKGNPSHIFHIWAQDHGAEYLVVDHPNLISKAAYEARKIFFKPKD